MVVNGMWTQWADDTCSVTCGGGSQTRTRTCTNPAPANGGEVCPGKDSEALDCNTQGCQGNTKGVKIN